MLIILHMLKLNVGNGRQVIKLPHSAAMQRYSGRVCEVCALQSSSSINFVVSHPKFSRFNWNQYYNFNAQAIVVGSCDLIVCHVGVTY